MSEQIREMLWAPSAQRIANSKMALDPRHPIVGESSLSLVSRRQRATRNPSVRDTATRLSVTSVCRHTITRPWNTAHDLV
jgi:hypothetical protein